jgi:hypothetical protein
MHCACHPLLHGPSRVRKLDIRVRRRHALRGSLRTRPPHRRLELHALGRRTTGTRRRRALARPPAALRLLRGTWHMKDKSVAAFSQGWAETARTARCCSHGLRRPLPSPVRHRGRVCPRAPPAHHASSTDTHGRPCHPPALAAAHLLGQLFEEGQQALHQLGAAGPPLGLLAAPRAKHTHAHTHQHAPIAGPLLPSALADPTAHQRRCADAQPLSFDAPPHPHARPPKRPANASPASLFSTPPRPAPGTSTPRSARTAAAGSARPAQRWAAACCGMPPVWGEGKSRVHRDKAGTGA